MSALERGLCGECGRTVALRRNGTMREHAPNPLRCSCSHDEGGHHRYTRKCRSCGCNGFGAPGGTCVGSARRPVPS